VEVRALLGVATAGVVAGELTASALSPGLLYVLALSLATLWLSGGRRRSMVLWAAVALAGLAVGAGRMAGVVAPTLPPDHVVRLALPVRTTLEARVVAAPQRRDGRTVLLVDAEAVGRGKARRSASGLVRVGVRGRASGWRYGDRLRVDTILRAPRNFENPGRFDYVAHLARRGVRVTAFVWSEDAIEHLPSPPDGVRGRLERWRARLAAAIGTAVAAPAGPVLQALIVGEEGEIDDELRDAFSRAGVIHILSISGLHVGLVAAVGFAAFRWLLCRSEWLVLAIDVERVAAAASLAPVALYTALAGLGVATLRSAIMVVAAVLAGLSGRRADVLRSLALAALVLALAWPGAPLEISFQLSFVSVLAIVLGVGRFGPRGGGGGWRERLRAAALVSPSALAGTAPLTALHFHQVSLVAVVANPIAVPIFGSIVVVVGLAGALVEPLAPAAARALFRVAGLVLRPGIALVSWLAAPGWAAVDVPIPSLVELGLLYGALCGLLLLPRRCGRLLAAVALAGLVADGGWWWHERFAHRLRATFLDVGQGDAAVLELPDGRVVVVDAGGFPGGEFDTGGAVVAPFLLTRKILRLDAVAMTHAHPDHFGGIAYLLAHFRPAEFWWSGVPGNGVEWKRLVAAVRASGARVRRLDSATTLVGDVTVLHPPPDLGATSINDSSLALRFACGRFSVLLTGDIEARAEQRLLARPDYLPSTVLKVPHHGSRTSSTPAFVSAVAPLAAVMSVGADNRYRLPAPDVERRYRARGICLYRTDRCGAVTMETDGRRLAVRAARPACNCPDSALDPSRAFGAAARQAARVSLATRLPGP